MKTLILKPSSLGDVVHALPVLRLLKAHEPAGEFYWWISSDLADLLRPDPDLNGLFLFQRRRWAAPRYWGELLGSIQQMRARRFDRIIDLQGLARSSMIGWLSRARFSIGVEDWREGAPALYDVAVRRPSSTTHAVDWYLEILKPLGVPVHWNFTWLPVRAQARAAIRSKWNSDAARWILFFPGARWPNKRWPVESFARLVQQLAVSHPQYRLAVLGGQSDAVLGAAIQQAAPHVTLDLTGQTTLDEVIEWIRLSALVITNDTGPMHVAAALSQPSLALFGPTDPRRTGPYRQLENCVRIRLPCAPCLKPACHYSKPVECLRGISPELAWARACDLLRLNTPP